MDVFHSISFILCRYIQYYKTLLDVHLLGTGGYILVHREEYVGINNLVVSQGVLNTQVQLSGSAQFWALVYVVQMHEYEPDRKHNLWQMRRAREIMGKKRKQGGKNQKNQNPKGRDFEHMLLNNWE